MPKKKTDPVIEECWRLSNLRFSAEMHQGWLALWQEHLQGERLLASDVYRVEAITSLGCAIALIDERFEDAIAYLNAYFSHPDVNQIDTYLNLSHQSNLCYCLLCSGEEHQAMEVVEMLLSQERRTDRRSALLLLNSALLAYVGNREGTEFASEELTLLIGSVVQLLRYRKTRRGLPQRATYETLTNLLLTAL
jgi:hypothetical protein